MVKKILDDTFYTLDKLCLEFMLRTEDCQELMNRFSFMTNVGSSVNNKKSCCHYSYNFNLEDDNSFWIGFDCNWKKFDSDIKYGRIEFNPAKVGSDLEFQSIYGSLYECVSYLNPIRFDLAIDIPVARDKVVLKKDKRTYGEFSNSNSDKTQYLGSQHNKHGFVKLYNKSLELGLNGIDLTRLELTIDYGKCSIGEIQRLIPAIYVLDNFQFDLNITGTDKVIMVAILGDIGLLNELGRDKRKKIEGYLANTQLSLELDINKYNRVLDYINDFKK